MSRALIIVDVQNDFCHGVMAVDGGDAIVPVINELMDRFDLVVALRDWHPPTHCSFSTTHGLKPGEVVPMEGYDQILWPPHCIANTKGAAYHDDLNTAKFAAIFDKGCDADIESYGAFFDEGRKRATGLEQFLRERGVKEIYLVGLTTEYCVKATAIDGAELGFSVFVIKDAVRPVNLKPDDEQHALAEMQHAGIRLISSNDVAS